MRKLFVLFLWLVLSCGWVCAEDVRLGDYGERLVARNDVGASFWWCSSGWKVGVEKALPTVTGSCMRVSAARNEVEAVQVVVLSDRKVSSAKVTVQDLMGASGVRIPASQVSVREVRYLNITKPTDNSFSGGLWPDPLMPHGDGIAIEPNRNQPFWITVDVPEDAAAGDYRGNIIFNLDGESVLIPLCLTIYGFRLPDRMSCRTAFGFSIGMMQRYHHLKSEDEKRRVLSYYWRSFADHHISPYDPAPLDHFQVTWPQVKPPPSSLQHWEDAVVVTNEMHDGSSALVIFDADRSANVSTHYCEKIPVGEKGLRLSFWYRTALPGHEFLVSLGHYDQSGKWMSGRNNDMVIKGSGAWQLFDRVITSFPKDAASVKLRLYGAKWSEGGEQTGLVWYDDVSFADKASGREFLIGGGFEHGETPPPVAPDEDLQVEFDFSRWDREMAEAIDRYHFNTFRLKIAGMGGGTYHELRKPQLLGFSEDRHEYQVMFGSYCRQMEDHLAERGWLDEAYVYWFDEPAAHQYKFVNDGFNRIKKYAPGIKRMLTEQVEAGLIGGPNIWCPVLQAYDEKKAAERMRQGEDFWWYVCCSPKAPRTGLFIDHAATEMRVWLWQTWKRSIKGILVWQSNYWTSSAAYPDEMQNAYAAPMSWTSGYSTPKGKKRPWGNGDGRFIYPPEFTADDKPIIKGPVESIRWEMLRDGIEDYEYFVMLKKLLAEHGDKLTNEKRKVYEGLLTVPAEVSSSIASFTKDPQPIETHRDKLARAIEDLSR